LDRIVPQYRLDRGDMSQAALRRINRSGVAKETGMLPKKVLDEISWSSSLAADRDVVATRRTLLLGSLIASLPLAVSGKAAKASRLDPAETTIHAS
jgi:hypothetical protein